MAMGIAARKIAHDAVPDWLWLMLRRAPHPLDLDGRLLFHADALPVDAAIEPDPDGLVWTTEDAVAAQSSPATARLVIFERPHDLPLFDPARLPGSSQNADATCMQIARAAGFAGLSTTRVVYDEGIGWFELRSHLLFPSTVATLRQHAIPARSHAPADTDESATTPELLALWRSIRRA